MGIGDGRIGVALGLRIAVPEIDDGPVAFDRDLDGYADRFVVHAVVVDMVFRLVDAVGKSGQPLPHAPFRIVQQIRPRPFHRLLAVSVEQASQAVGADHQRTDLGADVAEGLVGHTDLVGDNPDDFPIFGAGFHDLHHRQAQPFKVDFPDAARHSAGGDAA